MVRFLLEGAPGRAVARRSLAISALLAIASLPACLSPQDIELDVPAEQVNVPPTFDPTKDVSPQGAVVCVSSLDETPTEFRVDNIRDGNDGQQLEARWFVDYAGGFTSYTQDTLKLQPGDPVYPATKRRADVLIDNFHRTLGSPFFVEVVISDGFAGPEVEPVNRAVAPGAYAATYRWAVVFKSGAPCE